LRQGKIILAAIPGQIMIVCMKKEQLFAFLDLSYFEIDMRPLQ